MYAAGRAAARHRRRPGGGYRTAAVLGALATPEVAERSDREGVLVVNAGNSHTTAFLVFRRRCWVFMNITPACCPPPNWQRIWTNSVSAGCRTNRFAPPEVTAACSRLFRPRRKGSVRPSSSVRAVNFCAGAARSSPPWGHDAGGLPRPAARSCGRRSDIVPPARRLCGRPLPSVSVRRFRRNPHATLPAHGPIRWNITT